MGTDEEIGQRDLGSGGAGLTSAVLQEPGVSLRASPACGRGEIEENDSQFLKPLRNRIGIVIADAQFREDHWINGGPFAEQAIPQKRGSPRMEGGLRIESIDQDIGIQENQGSRVCLRSSSELIFGVRAADFISAASLSAVGFSFFGAGITLVNS